MKRKMFAGIAMAVLFCGVGAVGCSGGDVVAKFVYADGTTIERTVGKGESLTDIPANSEETGYTFVWDTTDFSSLKESVTVTEVKTANEYKIYYRLDGGATMQSTTQTVIYGESFALYVPTMEGYTFKYWVIVEPNTKAGERVTDGVYDIADDLTLQAEWEQ